MACEEYDLKANIPITNDTVVEIRVFCDNDDVEEHEITEGLFSHLTAEAREYRDNIRKDMARVTAEEDEDK